MSYCSVGNIFPRPGCSPNQLKGGEERSNVILLRGKYLSETWLQPKSVERGRREKQCHIAPWEISFRDLAAVQFITKEKAERSNGVLFRVNISAVQIIGKEEKKI